MTDKLIMINGVDVSGCKYYDDGTCCNEDVFTLSCENTNCMYKQLKRKEQECEGLKKTIAEIKDIAENVQSFVDIRLEDDVYTEMDKILQKISECGANND